VHVAIIFMVYNSVQVDIACTSKRPDFFLITLKIPGGRVLKVSNITHQPGQPVSDFHISIPQNVRNVCTFDVIISAGNSAGNSVGMSSPLPFVKHGELNCSFKLCYYPYFNLHKCILQFVQVTEPGLLVLELEVLATGSKTTMV